MEQKTTILVLTNNIGGLHSFRKEVMKAMIDAGYNVVISHPDEDERIAYFTNISCEDVLTEFNRRGMNPVKDLLLLIKYLKLIKTYKPFAVLTYTIKPNVYGGIACRLTGTPQLANVTGLGDAVENGGLLQRLAVFLYKLGIGKAKRVFFQNKNNLQYCVNKGIVKDNIELLPGSGVNLAYHQYQEFPKDGVVKFLFISRLIKDKGTDEYFKAAINIKGKYPNTEFQILGKCEGDFEKRLNDLVSRGIIKYLGYTTDVRPFIKDIHCTIMPSYHEGMSNVNLESAANGRPVITTRVPGCIETIEDGISGFLCEPKSAESLISSIEKFISLSYEEKKAMGIAGRGKVKREFDRQIVVDRYMSEIS